MGGMLPDLTAWHGDTAVHHYYVCDVFTSTPLQGNQLGVFVEGSAFDTDQMQAVARELNIAETVFLLPPQQGGDVRMRIFTPGEELSFAGHPVLGTAFVVGEALGKDDVLLETGLGVVPVALDRKDGRVTFGRMQQPVATPEPYDRERELLAAVGVERSLLPVELYRNGPKHTYVNLESEQAVAALRPDAAALEDLGVCVSCFAGEGRRWKTRLFGAAVGIVEDPATGSAAGPLAIHLARHGRIDFGEEIEISQGKEINRPSLLYARVTGSAEHIESVEVGGSAVIVAEGRMRVTT
jgi:trans-2,3-dihydro-3-hydroxyanthranilate isomerase